MNVSFINFHLDPNDIENFRPVQKSDVVDYFKNYMSENSEKFFIRISEILSLLDKHQIGR